MNKRPLKMSILCVLCEMSNISLLCIIMKNICLGLAGVLWIFCNFTAI